MSKENETLDKAQNGNDFIADVSQCAFMVYVEDSGRVIVIAKNKEEVKIKMIKEGFTKSFKIIETFSFIAQWLMLSISGVAEIETPNYQLKTKVDMKLELKITDEQGNEHLYNIVRSSSDEPKNLNDFILEALSISEDKRELPLLTRCPNDLEVFPSIKMKFENYNNPLLNNKLEAMMITWCD